MLVAAGAEAQAWRKPKNFRRAKKPAPAVRPAEAEPEPAFGLDVGRRWTREIQKSVVELVETRGSSAAVYNADRPPVAVIDRGAAVDGDAAEAVFFRLVTEAEFKFGDDFWEKVPIGFGRQRLRVHYEQFSVLPRSVWTKQPAYRMYRKGFLGSYKTICEKVGLKECRSLLASLLIGFGEQEARDYAARVIEDESKQEPREVLVVVDDQDQEPVVWKRGFAVVPEARSLVGALRAAGFDVWAIGLTAQPVLLAEAALWGVDATRCLGIVQTTEREKLSGQLKEPVPIRVGAVEAVIAQVARRPVLTVAGSAAYADLALYTEGLRVIVDRGDVDLLKRISGAGLVQPPFAAPRAKK